MTLPAAAMHAGSTDDAAAFEPPRGADALHALIDICKDGDQGFRACSEHAASPELRSLFLRRAEHCRYSATELQAHVATLDDVRSPYRSRCSAAHGGAVAVRGTAARTSDLAMLEDCERGEDAALACYRHALNAELPAATRGLVERQYQSVVGNHAQIRRLREHMRATD